MSHSNAVIRMFAVFVCLAAAVTAQDVTGSVQGRVTDPSGAAVPNARVELVNERTNVSYAQSSSEAGTYIFNLVPPGRYTVRTTAAGFQQSVLVGITVEVNRTTRADVSLTVGAVTETVEVSAAGARVDTVSAQLSTTASTKLVTELPSASRNVLKLAELSPGVNILNPDSQVLNIETTYANVNGNRQGRNVFYLDGSDNTASFRNSALQTPNPEAVQEVNISTSNIVGRVRQAARRCIQRGHEIRDQPVHGSGFYFFTDSALNASPRAHLGPQQERSGQRAG